MTETDAIAEAGVSLIGFRVSHKLKWLYRPQPVSDQGIDAQFEVAESGRGTGALLAAQIKTGESYFREPFSDGWVFRFSARHHRLWLNHALPVIVLLVDLNDEAVYWQHVHESTVEEAGDSYKLLVPQSNRIESAAEIWEHLASGNERRAEDQYAYNRQVLPPSTRQVFDEHFTPVTPHAAMVAMHLATGRGNAEGTVQALLTSRPLWVESNPWLWRAVGSYASEHLLHKESAEAFQASASAFLALPVPDTDQAATSFAASGINILGFDVAKAKELLERAEELGGESVAAQVGFVLLDATLNDFEIDLPGELMDTSDRRLTESELVQTLAGNFYLSRGERNEGVRRLEMALAAAPESSKTMAQLAHHLASRDHSASRQSDDLSRAEALLIQAIQQRRAWAGPTTALLRELARSLALQGKGRELLYWLRPPPRGTATVREAEDVELVRESLRAAYVSRELELAQELGDLLGDEPTDQLLRARTNLAEVPDDELIELLRTEAGRALDSNELQELAGHIHALADLGVDETRLLDGPLAAGHVEPWLRDMFVGIAQARSSNNRDLTKLKAAARSASMSAEVLISIYAQDGRLDDAIDAATTAQLRFRNSAFALKKADLLVKAGRHVEAEQAAATALASTNQFPDSRQELSTFLVWRAYERGDWADAEAIAARTLEEAGPPTPAAAWVLVEVQVASGHHQRAIDTLNRHRPPIGEIKHARLWCQAHAGVPWDDEIVTKALDLIEQFEDDHGFAGQVLSQIVSTTTSLSELEPDPVEGQDYIPPPPGLEPGPYMVPVISDSLRTRAFVLLDKLAHEHAEESGIRVIEEEDDNVMLERFIAMTRDKAERHWEELPDLLARGRIGAGMLAAYLRSSYALTLIQQAAGYHLASDADPDEHMAEVRVAREALDADVIDTSALVVTNCLTDGQALRDRFRTLYLPPAELRDITQAEFELRANGASPGSFGWDPDTQRPTYRENTKEAHRLASARLVQLVLTAGDTISRDAPEPEDGRFGDLPESARSAPWFAPLRLAATHDLPLWGDDLAARRLAGALGIRVFGTPALVDSLVEDLIAEGSVDQAIDTAARASEEFIRNGVVDVPVNVDQLLSQGDRDEWMPNFGALVLSRPAWWAGLSEPLNGTLTVLAVAAAKRPDSAGKWQFAAMLGAARAHVDPDQACRILAVLALVGPAASSAVEAADLLEGFANARRVAEQTDLPDPLQLMHGVRVGFDDTDYSRPRELVDEVLKMLDSEGDGATSGSTDV